MESNPLPGHDHLNGSQAFSLHWVPKNFVEIKATTIMGIAPITQYALWEKKNLNFLLIIEATIADTT